MAELPNSAVSLDAWTREDPAALRWYWRKGFSEHYQYLHVYKNGDGDSHGFIAPSPVSVVVHAHCHAQLENEGVLRAQFDRVYVCTQFLREVSQ